VAVGKAEVFAGLGQPVQFVWRLIVAEVVATVVREPQFARYRVKVEPDGVPDAAGHHLGLPSAEVETRDGGMERPGRLADVARCADRNVETPIRAEGDELPAVALLRWVPVCHDLGYGRTTEVTRHVAESEDSSDGRHVEMTTVEGHTAGPLEVARQHVAWRSRPPERLHGPCHRSRRGLRSRGGMPSGRRPALKVAAAA
jgi:hypothetical protein